MHCHAPKVQPVAGVGPSSCHARVLMLMLDTRQWWGVNMARHEWSTTNRQLRLSWTDGVWGLSGRLMCRWDGRSLQMPASIPIKFEVSGCNEIYSDTTVMPYDQWVMTGFTFSKAGVVGWPGLCLSMMALPIAISEKVELISEISDIRWYQHISRCVTWRIVTRELIRTCIRTCQKWHRVTFAAEGLIAIRTLRRDSRFVTLLL